MKKLDARCSLHLRRAPFVYFRNGDVHEAQCAGIISKRKSLSGYVSESWDPRILGQAAPSPVTFHRGTCSRGPPKGQAGPLTT